MRHLELHRFKKAVGKVAFGFFFPNENKKLNQKHGIGKQPDLVLVTPGTQTTTVKWLRTFTGWTVKKATAFFKEGHYPKVVIYDVKSTMDVGGDTLTEAITGASEEGVIFEVK